MCFLFNSARYENYTFIYFSLRFLSPNSFLCRSFCEVHRMSVYPFILDSPSIIASSMLHYESILDVIETELSAIGECSIAKWFAVLFLGFAYSFKITGGGVWHGNCSITINHASRSNPTAGSSWPRYDGHERSMGCRCTSFLVYAIPKSTWSIIL